MNTKRMIKALTIVTLAVTLTGCSSQFFTPYDKSGRISLNADEKGMRAFTDLMAGLVNEGKTPAGQKGAHYILREEQERTEQMSWQAKIQSKYNKEASNE